MTASPFKFLDSYSKDDAAIFFGRAQEVDQLYGMLFRTDIVLVYGPSGTGKTSLIQCGLANRFQDSDWLPVFVRRRQDLNRSLREEIARAAETPVPQTASLTEAVESLYLDHLRPVYLIFDQFEEAYLLGSPAERAAFIESLATLLKSSTTAKVIISLREEYLALLHDFERVVPNLFDQRLRVEQMSLANVERVILGTLDQLGIVLEGGAATARAIIDNLSDSGERVQLAYLQVYLDRLWRDATAGTPAGPVVFTPDLIARTGELDDVLADFLDRQTLAIQQDLATRHPGVDAAAVQQVLETHATLEGTKAPMTRADMAARMPALAPVLDEILAALENARILRANDDTYELAHDSLALRIADRRDVARKGILRLEKMVKDSQAAFDLAKIYLTKQELALLKPYKRQLQFTPAQTAFINRSRLHGWVSRFRGTAVFLVAAIGIGVVLFAILDDTDITDPAFAHKAATDYMKFGEYSSAVSALEDAIGEHPDDHTLLFDRADANIRLGKTSLALEDLGEIRKTSAGSGEKLNRLCLFEATRGIALNQALADCEAAMNTSDAVESQALVYLKLDRPDDALTFYDDVLTRRPGWPTALYGAALARMKIALREAAGSEARARAILAGKDSLAAAEKAEPGIAERFKGWGLTPPGAEPANPAPAAP